MKVANDQMHQGARWILAVTSTEGTRAVNVIVHGGRLRQDFSSQHTQADLGPRATSRPTPPMPSGSQASEARYDHATRGR
jgi:hypothetical protein